jgi:phage tail sheath protein FI
MPFQLSPGVAVVEKDFTSIVPAVSSSIGAFAGTFPWGPVLEPVTVSSENDLVRRFGKPNDSNFQSFFTAANFLSYTNNLLLVRADAGSLNAVATTTGGLGTVTVNNAGSGYSSTAAAPAVTVGAPDIDGGSQATVAVTLSGGEITAVAVSSGGSGYATAPSVTISAPSGGTGATFTTVLSAPTISGVAISGTGGQFTCTATTLVVGSTINITGSLGGTGTITGYATGTTYKVSAITGSGSSVTGFTLTTTADVAIVTTAGTPTGLTYSVTSNQSVASVTVSSGGSGYKGTVTATFSAGNATAGSVTVGSSTITGATITTAGSGYSTEPTITVAPPPSGTTATLNRTITVAGVKITNGETYNSTYVNGAGIVGSFAAKYPGTLGNSLKVAVCDSAGFSTWAYKDEFDSAPGTSTYASSKNTANFTANDELHIIVIDEDAEITGTYGAILEKFAFVSKASDAKKPDGTNNYYKNVINSRSEYIWWMDHPTAVTGTANWGSAAAGSAFKTLTAPLSISLTGGTDDFVPTEGELQSAFALFANAEQYDISLIMAGKATAATATYIINNICETRLDCVAFISPESVANADVIIGSTSTEQNAIIAYRAALPSTSYAVLDSGYKYQYDRYSDKYRYVPLNGDIAGLCARTDYTNDPWFSPGGLNRGQIKNVVKLAFNPSKTQRDMLYKSGVNPVVTFPGEGTVMFGDKTLLAKPSAFDRINVRRLFIVMEKAIATAAKFQLFEFNDGFTRAQFKNLVEPFLRDVQGRRGITDFVVKCDESNNTGEVIDRNEFVADIFVKPNRSINFITLNFVAARSAINFSEIGA